MIAPNLQLYHGLGSDDVANDMMWRLWRCKMPEIVRDNLYECLKYLTPFVVKHGPRQELHRCYGIMIIQWSIDHDRF